jgi:hypothetical protein
MLKKGRARFGVRLEIKKIIRKKMEKGKTKKQEIKP